MSNETKPALKRALNPCPFCSSTDVHVDKDGAFFIVECLNNACLTLGPTKRTEDEAATAWNASTATNLQGALDALARESGSFLLVLRAGDRDPHEPGAPRSYGVITHGDAAEGTDEKLRKAVGDWLDSHSSITNVTVAVRALQRDAARSAAEQERRRLVIEVRQWSLDTGAVSADTTNALIDHLTSNAPPSRADDE